MKWPLFTLTTGSILQAAAALEQVGDAQLVHGSWCFTYLSSYLAPVQTEDVVSADPDSSTAQLAPGILPPLVGNRTTAALTATDSGSSEVTELPSPEPDSSFSFVPPLPSELSLSSESLLLSEPLPSSELLFPSESLTTLSDGQVVPVTEPSSLSLSNVATSSEASNEPTSGQASTTSSAAVVSGQAVILSIVPRTTDEKRGLAKRALGGFIGGGNLDIARICTNAAVFNLALGQLLDQGTPVYYSAGDSFKQLSGQGPPPDDAITRTFLTFEDNLVFSNSALPNGRADFCQDSDSGQVFITFVSAPSDCVPISLRVYGVEQCQNSRIVGEDSLDSTSKQPAQTSSIDEPITATTEAENSTLDPLSSAESSSTTRASSLKSTGSLTIIDTFSETAETIETTQSLDSSTSSNSMTSASADSPSSSSTEPLSSTSDSSSFSFTLSPDLASSSDTTTFSPGFPSSSDTISTDLPFSSSTSLTDLSSSTRLQPTDSSSISGTASTDLPSSMDLSTSSSSTTQSFPTSTTSTDSTSPSASSSMDSTTSSLPSTEPTSSQSTSSSETTLSTESSTTSEDTTTFSDTTSAASSSTDSTTTTTTTSSCDPVTTVVLTNPTPLFAGSFDRNDGFTKVDVPGDDVYVSINGLITAEGGTSESLNQPLPAATIPRIAFIPYWDDLAINDASSKSMQNVYYENIQTTNGRQDIFEWFVSKNFADNVYHFTAAFDSWQPVARFRYYSVPDKGSSATIGIQLLDSPTQFVQVSFNQAGAVDGGTEVIIDYGALAFTVGEFDNSECGEEEQEPDPTP